MKNTINYSWPVQLLDFSKDTDQGNYSRGKLKVYYEGETADHRLFSEKFSKKLVKTLPYTPIVSYWDSEKEDFVGHATEQQILGIVDPCVEPTFEKDDKDVNWCVCDVVFYTERPDQVGELAKKIVGHPQSLELDPSTVKYTINYDEKRHFKNIEFTDGTFVGVSVLGYDQQPAFTGSAFFTYNEDFENKMKKLREYCENGYKEKGGQIMDFKQFMKLSWGEICTKVDEKIYEEYGNEAFTMVIDCYNDSVIVRFYSYIDGSNKLFRINYSCDENGIVTLGDVTEVHITYEDVASQTEQPSESTNMADTGASTTSGQTETGAEQNSNDVNTMEKEPEQPAAQEEATSKEEFTNTDPAATESSDPKVDTNQEPNSSSVSSSNQDVFANSASETNADDPEQLEQKESESHETDPQENSSSTSFAQSEREEYEALKREKKLNILASYKDTLSEEQYADFTARINDFSESSLELELLKIYKEQKDNSNPVERVFNTYVPLNNNNSDSDTLDSIVRKHLR